MQCKLSGLFDKKNSKTNQEEGGEDQTADVQDPPESVPVLDLRSALTPGSDSGEISPDGSLASKSSFVDDPEQNSQICSSLHHFGTKTPQKQRAVVEDPAQAPCGSEVNNKTVRETPDKSKLQAIERQEESGGASDEESLKKRQGFKACMS